MQPSEERVAAAEALHARANDCSDRGRPEEARTLLSEALLLLGEPEDPGSVPDQGVARASGAARVTARILISLAAQGDELAPDESLSERRLARALALATSSGSHDVALTVHGHHTHVCEECAVDTLGAADLAAALALFADAQTVDVPRKRGPVRRVGAGGRWAA